MRASELLIEKISDHLNVINGQISSYKFIILKHLGARLPTYELQARSGACAYIMFGESLNIYQIDHPVDKVEHTRARVYSFYYHDRNSFTYDNIIRAINAVIIVDNFILANEALVSLLEDDRNLSAMTSIVDVNTTFISCEAFAEFHIAKLKQYHESYAVGIDNCVIIDDYFKLANKLLDSCRDLVTDVKIHTFPCLEFGIPVKVS